jgi:hypothetical protein
MKYRGRVETGRWWLRASWPFATLDLQPHLLCLRAPIMGSLTFTPEDIIRISPVRSIPFGSGGVAITYESHGQPRTARFFGWVSPSQLLADMASHGFYNPAG